ncbi:hypothetical protein VNI00_007330 [Paramarasmius palmivorus]|uniref:Endonuclease/exonuclease/phosphatase domain-containing protein n=1 Tax=Paramarasmius palmivorus TaxID=297713 RepID=A0AAW0D3V8_9AGAR
MAQNQAFWEELTAMWLQLKLPVPDIMLGDCNIVEDPSDQSNNCSDHQGAVDALTTFKSLFELRDGWRTTFPNNRAFTHRHINAHGSLDTMSRINRIYVAQEWLPFTLKWDIIDHLGGRTDHRMVITSLTKPEIPYQGRGRYTVQPNSIENSFFIDQIIESTLPVQDGLNAFRAHPERRTSSHNPQVVWKK